MPITYTLATYRDLVQIINPTPTALGALAFNTNFVALTDAILANATLVAGIPVDLSAIGDGKVLTYDAGSNTLVFTPEIAPDQNVGTTASPTFASLTLAGTGSGGGSLTLSGGSIYHASSIYTDSGSTPYATQAWVTGQGYSTGGGSTPPLSAVLTAGNDGGAQTIANISGISPTSGSFSFNGGAVNNVYSIEFADSTTQTTAYTGGGGSTPTLSEVLAAGNDGGEAFIDNISGINGTSGSFTFNGTTISGLSSSGLQISDGFTGTGSYTNFTIVNGIITAAT